MTLTVKPLKGRVLIKPDPHVPVDTFLHLPEESLNRDMPCYGTVFAIGGRPVTRKGVILDHEFKIGDRVFFPKFTGLWVTIVGQKFIQVEHKDIAAVMT